MTDTCKSITFPQLPPSPTVPLCVSVLTFLGVPFCTPTGLHPHPLYLYVSLYLIPWRTLSTPTHFHPHQLYLYVCLYLIPWHTPQHTYRSPPSPTVPLCMSVLNSLAYPSAHQQLSTLTNCTSMYLCTYVPWRTPRHTHTFPPSPTVSLST